MFSEKSIAIFLILTALAYVIAYIFYAERTFNEQASFFHIAVFYLLAGIFFLIYAIANYYNLGRKEKLNKKRKCLLPIEIEYIVED